MSSINDSVWNIVSTTFQGEFNKLALGEDLAGSNSEFAIRPTFAVNENQEPISVYGIFNRTTGVRETETRQYSAAKEWVQALTAVAKGEPLPGLSRVGTAAKPVTDGGQVH